MSIRWEPLREIIDSHQRFVISSHVRPDADALGSALALAGILEAEGKQVRIVNPSSTPAHLQFLDPDSRVQRIGKDVSVETMLNTDVHIVVDTSAWVQLVDVGKVLKQTSAVKVVIDHHVSADDIAEHQFKDTSAEATGTLIYQMARALHYPVTAEIALPLFCAIATDTGWFRFSSTSGETYRIAGHLLDLGVEPHLVYEKLYEQNSLARVKLTARVLTRVELDCDGRLAHITVSQEDFKETGANTFDTDDLVNETLKIAGTQAAFIAIERPDNSVKVSLRSRTGVNVAAIAEKFGGGGHKQAAGLMMPGSLENAITTLKPEFAAALNDASIP